MPSLGRENRKNLENTVAQAREIAVEGARKVLKDQYAVESDEPWPHMKDVEGDSPEELTAKKLARELRSLLRAHARQLGDKRDSRSNAQEIRRLVEACAYEHWHRMLFARFLAENDLLLDSEHDLPMTIEEVQELAREQGRDWMEIAAELAQQMLLAVFRPDDPVLRVQLPPETQQQLEGKLAALPREIFLAHDSLGWVYQFWQRDEKKRVNDSEVKIGADELPAVTQLFTEDYMVLFLLENTLGAWWTAKRRAEGKDPALPGYEWTYLRLNEEGSPAAGSFDGWPRTAAELRILDPCMGSGHFLVFALPILARMRMEEEGLQLQEALTAVLRENLIGLEIDVRCSQIAAFNLALAAWRQTGEHFSLPELQLACSGLGPNCTKEQWMSLAEEVAGNGGMPAKTNRFGSENSLLSEPVRNAMDALYELFSQAPLLGSLIDPSNLRGHLFEADYQAVANLFAGVLEAQNADENTRERLIAAAGMMKAATFLAGKYSLVATNVPYLVKAKQHPKLRSFCEAYADDASTDLATVFLNRCVDLCGLGGTSATVTPQNWLYIKSYSTFRKRLLTDIEFCHVAAVGSGATATESWDVLRALAILTNRQAGDNKVTGIETDAAQEEERSRDLKDGPLIWATWKRLLQNPDSRISLVAASDVSSECPRLSAYAECLAGVMNGDTPRFIRKFWELPENNDLWAFLQSTVSQGTPIGGLENIIFFDEANGHLREEAKIRRVKLHNADERGNSVWGRPGVAISQMSSLPASRYFGNKYDSNIAVIVPNLGDHIVAIWAFCSSDSFYEAVRAIDRKLNVTNATFGKVRFDLAYWQKVAGEKYPQGLPKPHSSDPTQWLFNGHPKGSDQPLQVAVARLLGYRWPRQTGSSFPDCSSLGPDDLEKHAEPDGIVPLNAIASESPASERLRTLLVNAFGAEWSAAKLHELLGEWDSLDEWLRDGFFEEHCSIFQQRPFVWHVWDGRKDGFHALVNYHMLVSPNGQGRQTLEKLIYTWLGRWIDRQNDEVRSGKEGADSRLTAALHLKSELEKILAGEKPNEIFVRWKPLYDQPIGWEPDINDGVRLNIRPWLRATLARSTKPKKDACVLRVTPKIKYGRDKGKESKREEEDYPWFWTWDPNKADPDKDYFGNGEFDGARWNDLHYSLSAKRHARAERKNRKGQKDQKELSVFSAGGRITE